MVLTVEDDVLPVTHAAYLSQPVNRLYFPYPGCRGDLVSEANLWQNLAVLYPEDLVSTPRDGCLPKCGQCGLQDTLAQQMRGHKDTEQYNEGDVRRGSTRQQQHQFGL